MRKLLLLTVALVLAAGIAVPALAGSGLQLSVAPRAETDGRATQFSLQGDVLRVFTTAGAMKVRVRLGSTGVRPFIGRELTMRVGGTPSCSPSTRASRTRSGWVRSSPDSASASRDGSIGARRWRRSTWRRSSTSALDADGASSPSSPVVAR